jgi:predicted O-methyltransferase YrrM
MLTIPITQLEVGTVRSFHNPYLNVHETAVLIALVKSVAPKIMIEIGCQRGATSKAVLDNVPTLERYIGVDVPWNHEPTLACQRSEVPYTAGLWAADDPRFSVLLRSSSSLGPQDLEPCDAVFIDGDHSESAVLHDSYLARALVQPGGIIVWHDHNNPAVEVDEALDKLYCEGWPIIHVQGTWLAYRRT